MAGWEQVIRMAGWDSCRLTNQLVGRRARRAPIQTQTQTMVTTNWPMSSMQMPFSICDLRVQELWFAWATLFLLLPLILIGIPLSVAFLLALFSLSLFHCFKLKLANVIITNNASKLAYLLPRSLLCRVYLCVILTSRWHEFNNSSRTTLCEMRVGNEIVLTFHCFQVRKKVVGLEQNLNWIWVKVWVKFKVV